MIRTLAMVSGSLLLLWLLSGCSAQPAPRLIPPGVQPTPSASGTRADARPAPTSQRVPATVPALRQFLPFVTSTSACPREYDEQRADGSVWHVKANCDGSFDTVKTGVPTPTQTLAPGAQGCPEGCSLPPPSCLIKAQISVSGEKTYQLPGWKHYAETVIDPRFGDRWFCTTAEAVANGWHASTDR